MNINQLAPWNWFKKEDEMKGASLPVRRDAPTAYSLHPFEQMHREMDRMFDDFFRNFDLPSRWRSGSFAPAWGADQWLKPSVDITSTDKEYAIHVELPGVTGDDVNVELTGNTLKIRGEKRQETEDKGRDYYTTERSYGSFQRVLSLPEDADENGVAATFKNGVMTITVPRKETPQSSARQIEIKTR